MKMQSEFHAAEAASSSVRTPELTLALVAEGRLGISDVVRLRRLAADAGVKPEDLLITSGRFPEEELLALAGQLGGYQPLGGEVTADPSALRVIGISTCRHLGFAVMNPLPWRALIAVSKPWNIDEIRALLPASHQKCAIALITQSHLDSLLRPAEVQMVLGPEESCRGWNITRLRLRAGLALGAFALAFALAPGAVMLALLVIGIVTMLATTVLKLAATYATLTKPAPARFASQRSGQAFDPVVSLLVPLYREADIAARLIKRLSRLERPDELLEVLLIAEDDDRETLLALEAAQLPAHFRIIRVPAGPVRTKPHALNHAVRQAQGAIIGIYDAEDEPAPGQISAVVQAFAQAAPDVACIQGQLDFYNTKATWITQMFTLDYAAWFRLVLPGIARMGLMVPLGGTTLFFRSDALERLGGWDDWNVTEDADLGLRLARHGWRCEVLETVTQEEATATIPAWLRQRARWQKGYLMTWATHMASPGELWRDLGAKRFIGTQVLIFGCLVQNALAPLFWSMWAFPFTDRIPLEFALGTRVMPVLFWLFIAISLLDIVVVGLGQWRRGSLRQMVWAPLLPFYYLLGSLALYRSLWELVTRPYHWDKTSHAVTE